MGRGRRFRDLREGDRIHVYSAGHRLEGKGVFIRFLEEEDDFL
ncbi:hypothetical protein [Bacillus thuringiensis]|nr:hypothetical protein [Bacillus thuringiensis]